MPGLTGSSRVPTTNRAVECTGGQGVEGQPEPARCLGTCTASLSPVQPSFLHVEEWTGAQAV